MTSTGNFTEYTEPMIRAFQAVGRGQNDKALQIIKDAGIPEAELELEMIINFVKCMENSK